MTRPINGLTPPDPPESLERSVSVRKSETEEKNKESPKFVRSFSAIVPISEIFAKSEKKSSESVRTKNHTVENKGFYFWISSKLVRIRPILEK